jgi:acetolactate synthase-1/2/3 large subunit
MSKMTGAQVLADMLAGYGVTHVFMVPAVLRRTFAEMERRTAIQRIHTRGEKSAAFAGSPCRASRGCPPCISPIRNKGAKPGEAPL